MRYIVKKKIINELEILPNLTDTAIWKDYDTVKCSKIVRLIATLYNAIEKRENYYQFNTPTAFGNPQYNYYCGLVCGILMGAEMEEKTEDNLITVLKNNKKILIIDKIKKPQVYYDTIYDNGKLMHELGL